MGDRVDFIDLARELGGRIEEVTLPNGAVMTETKWDPASGRALLGHFDEIAAQLQPGDSVEFGGHTDPWVMLGLIYRLRHCRLSTYLSAFDCTVPIEAYAKGTEPVRGQTVLFQTEEKGESIILRLSAGEPALPFEMNMSQMALTPIPAGRDVYLELGDAKILNLLGLALSLGEKCRSLYMEQGNGVYRCAISHTADVQPGDDRFLY